MCLQVKYTQSYFSNEQNIAVLFIALCIGTNPV